jgi:DHA1 family bicyclomycin/chloramphenicol resistance-like MFS transporter
LSHDALRPAGAIPLTALLLGTIAIQTAIPPFATDMYTPAFPRVVADLGTTASLVGLTLTTFFLGFALGQLVGGPWSDQRGRRVPILVGGAICTLGAIGCALSPSVYWLIAARVVQGFGGGIAAAVARAVIVDVAHGTTLAKVMSVMQAIGGLAPMIAPVVGALVLTVATWRAVFWTLVIFGVLMVTTAAFNIPETLEPERRHSGGLRRSLAGIVEVVQIRPFLAYMLTSAFSTFGMMAYVANSSYVLQVMKGMKPIQFSLFFAATAFTQVLLSIVNARLVGRVSPRRLIAIGLTSSSLAVLSLVLGVFFWGTPLILTCAGFMVLMASQAFVFGNAGALAASKATHIAGAAAAVQGVAASLAGALAAPLASAGGGATAVPMVLVMVTGVTLSITALTIARRY